MPPRDEVCLNSVKMTESDGEKAKYKQFIGLFGNKKLFLSYWDKKR